MEHYIELAFGKMQATTTVLASGFVEYVVDYSYLSIYLSIIMVL
jgi:hypothetical protein